MRFLKHFKLIIPILFLSFLVSCNKDNSASMSKANPTITVRLVDAPGDYDAVNIDIQDVMIKMDDDSDSESGWISLDVNPETVNLLDFTGGFNKVLVERFPIPVGTLSQMRLVLGDGNTIEMRNESDESMTYDLKTPSAQQSGLKLKVDAEIEEGFTYDFVIDFDVEKSIVHAGNSGNIILKPVLYVSAEASSGIIEGTVSPADVPAMASVLVDDMGDDDPSNDFVVSAYTDENGAFALWGVPAGTYEVMVTPTDENSDYSGGSAADVVVTNGEITTIAEPIEMMLKPATITGTVSGLADGVKATVSINDSANTSVETGDAGAYEITGIAPGEYTVTISAEGYVSQEFNVTLDPDETETVDATLVAQ